MSSLAQELDEYLRGPDAERAQHVEAAIRGLMAMTNAQPLDAEVSIAEADGLDSLAAYAEPIGAMTIEELDRASRTVELARGQRLTRRSGVTTDAVVGESCTLLAARRKSHLIPRLLEFSEESRLLKVLHLDEQLVAATKKFLRAHLDHQYSFVDCSSFVVMSLRRLHEAATTEAHFVEAGFEALLR